MAKAPTLGSRIYWQQAKTMTTEPQLQETEAATLADLDIDLTSEEQHESRWYVVVHNDDITPFDYVLRILTGLFLLSDEMAEHVAQTAHSEGKAVVVVRPRPEAERLVKVALSRSRLDGYPLSFTIEPEHI
jgi:ATP-dependent Clp protease adaptor protein ClpS